MAAEELSMMTEHEFALYARDHIKDFLPTEYESAVVGLELVSKNNNQKIDRLSICNGDKGMHPSIPLDGAYQMYLEGADIDVCLRRLADFHCEYLPPKEESEKVISDITNPDYVRENVFVTAINAEMNAELLKDVPHEEQADLSLIYRCRVDLGGPGLGSFIIKNNQLDMWKMTGEELKERAMENSDRINPAEIMDMETCLRGMMGNMGDDMPMPFGSPGEMNLYVITNKERLHGAAALFYSKKMEDFCKKIQDNLIILPSSIHEVLAIPASKAGDPKELASMVKEINATQLAPDEILSDHVYFYDAKEKTLTLADVSGEELGLSEASEEKQANETRKTGAARPRHHR